MARFNPSDLSRLGISGISGGPIGIGGAHIGDVARLMGANKSTNGGPLDSKLIQSALMGNISWGQSQGNYNQQPVQPAVAPTPAPQNNLATIANPYQQQFSSGLQSILGNTTSNLPADFYSRVASMFGNYDPRSTHTNGGLGVFRLDPSVMSQYGSGNAYGLNNQIGAYVNYTNKNYTDLQTMLGRQPTQAEVYAANNHGVDTAHQMILGSDPALQQYSQLFI